MRARIPMTAVVVIAAAACGNAPPTTTAVEQDAFAAGEALYLAGQFDSARAVWDAAVRLPHVPGTPDEARLYTGLGLIAMRLGELGEARELGERGLAAALHQALHGETAQARNALGLLAWTEGRLTEAAELLAGARSGFEADDDEAGVARASSNLALVSYELGRFDEARAAFQDALAIARRIGNTRTEGRVLSNLGMLEIWTGDPRAALDILTRAVGRATEAADVVGLANALGQTGVAYVILGEPGAALVQLDSAVAVARAAGLRDEEANNLAVIAGIYAGAGDVDQALRANADARRINEELGLTIEAGTVLREEATLRAGRGVLEQARRDALEALALHRAAGARREEFLDLLALADIERRGGDVARAATWLSPARQLSAELGSAQSRLHLALAEARVTLDAGDAAHALRTLAGVEDDLHFGGAAAVAEANALRLRAWSALDRLDSAAVAGRRAIDAIERVRSGFAFGPLRTSYVAERSRVYADLVVTLLRQGEVEQALGVADAVRGRALLEHLVAARDGVRSSPVLRDLAEAERLLRLIDQLLAQLARQDDAPPQERGSGHSAASDELRAHLERARSEYNALLVRAAERDPARARLIGAQRTGSVDVRAVLRPDEAVLEYLPTEDRLFVFIVRADGVRALERPIGQTELVGRVQLGRELMARRLDDGAERAVLESLHELLVAPALADGALAGARHLFVVPHGALAYLPFATLRDAAGRTLIDDYTIAYLPAAGVLPVLRARSDAVITAGGTAFAPFPGDLPSTAAEAQAFARALPRGTRRAGSRATEAAVRAALADRGVVHVATHGVMNPRNPLFSRIELAPGGRTATDDGRLEVHELLDMTVNSPLVFLSGCQTALGGAWSTAFDQGQDFATLAQAFLIAGARSVVATLWRVDDEGAAALAARFYHHLQSRTPAEALAAAQRDLRADPRWRSPYYWAAYTISGDWPAPAQIRQQPAVQ